MLERFLVGEVVSVVDILVGTEAPLLVDDAHDSLMVALESSSISQPPVSL